METHSYNYITGYYRVCFKDWQQLTSSSPVPMFITCLNLHLYVSSPLSFLSHLPQSVIHIWQQLIWPNGNQDCAPDIPILLPDPWLERNNTFQKIPSENSMTSRGHCTYTLLNSPWNCLKFCMLCAAGSPMLHLS